MILREGFRFKERHLNVCSNYGGLGDHIARLPAIRYIQREHPHVRLTTYWHEYFVPLARTLVPESETLRHKSVSEMAYADDKLPLIDFSPDYLTSLSLGLVDHGFIMLAQRLPPTREDRVYPKFKSDWERGIDVDGFGDYVVITPCYTSVVRMFPGTEVNKLIQGIHALGFKTALLGNTTKISTGNGHKLEGGIPEGLDLTLPSLNLINQTSLIDALNIMAHAKCVVGVDNGLLHLAACTDTPSVWGFTTVEKELRLPEGIKAESVLPDEVYGCQSKTYLVEHDFTKCMFDTCLCVSGMKAEKFLQGVKKVLDLS